MTTNLRPIILFAVLRKILSVMMMGRIKKKMEAKIPVSQAAYTSGRSTTKHIFSIKIVAERTVNSEDEEVHLILLDMSKAFDTMNRKTLLKDLSEIIDEDELQIMQIMLNVKLRVRCGNEYSDFFQTDTGGPQGDSSSANEFTFYLAKALIKYYTERRNTYIITEHNYSQSSEKMNLPELCDHNYTKINREELDIDLTDIYYKVRCVMFPLPSLGFNR